MSLPLTAGTVRTGWLARANPSAKLAAATVVGLGTLAASDAVTPTLVLLGALLAVRLGGVPLARLLRRTWPLYVSAAGIGLANALFTTADDRLYLGVAAAVRVVALGLPGIAVLLTIDPTDLADSLVQQLRVPAKFAYGALAALRLLPLLADEWATIAVARRARGVDAGRSPLRAARLFGGQVFGLLVGAIRRASRLAVAMDSRGFDAAVRRTYARVIAFRRSDGALVLGSGLLVVGALVLSGAVGTLRLVLAHG